MYCEWTIEDNGNNAVWNTLIKFILVYICGDWDVKKLFFYLFFFNSDMMGFYVFNILFLFLH